MLFINLRRYVIAIVMLTLITTSTVSAKPIDSVPIAKNAAVQEFIEQKDGEFGYQILRPVGWTTLNYGDRRSYFPIQFWQDGQFTKDWLQLTVMNLKTISDTAAEQNIDVAQMSLFEMDPTLEGWTQNLEEYWQGVGTTLQLEETLPFARVYSPGQSADWNLVAFVVFDGQPLMAVLSGGGIYDDLDTLREQGWYADFTTMVASLVPLNTKVTEPVLTEPEVKYESTPSAAIPSAVTRSTPYSFGWHCHGSSCHYAFTGTLLTRWESSNDTVERLYESMTYAHAADGGSQATLYRTNVTDDDVGYWCIYSGGYISHTILKSTSTSQSTVSDDYYPYYSNGSIGAQTNHGAVLSQTLVTYCPEHQPYY